MGYTVSGLTDYVNQNRDELLTALQIASETADLANVVTGVKSSEALQLLATSPFPQDGSTCAFNASGDAAFTQRLITTKPVKYQDSFCPRALEAKWTQRKLKKGQHYSESDLAKDILDDVVKQIHRRNEVMDWQGDLANGDGYKNKYNGLIQIIEAASPVIATPVAGPVTTSNIRTIVQNVISAIPAAQKGDPNMKIYMGYDLAEMYRQKMFIDNLYHFQANGDQKGLMAEGSVHEIVPVHGLDGLGASAAGSNPFIFAIDFGRNVYLGVDMENEEEDARVWVDGSDGETIKYSFRFRRGWQIAYGSEIVQYANV